MAAPLNRAWYDALVDDTGDGASGTVWNKAQVDGLLDTVDASLVSVVDRSGTPAASQIATFSDADTVTGAPGVAADAAGGGVLLESPTGAYVQLTDLAQPAASRTLRVLNVGGAFRVVVLDAGGAVTQVFFLARDGTIVTAGGIVLNNGGLTFPAVQMPSASPTTIDDFQKKRPWTPIIIANAGNSGQVYAVQEGRYTKVGSLVQCIGRLTFSNAGTFAAQPNILFIGGLPVPAGAEQAAGVLSFGVANGLGLVVSSLAGYVIPNATYCALSYTPAGGGTNFGGIPATAITNTTDLVFSITYHAAQ